MMDSPYRSRDDRFPYVAYQNTSVGPIRFCMMSDRSESWYSSPSDHDPYLALIRPGDVVLDAGANEGYTAILAAKKSKTGMVVAIEAARHNIGPLNINIGLNHLETTVVVSHGALTQHAGTVELCGEIVGPGEPVRALTLMEFCSLKPNVIKIDIEGYEVKALRGGFDMLASCRPVIFLEAHLGGPDGVNMERFGDSAADIVDIVRNLNYTMLHKGAVVTEPSQIPDGAIVLMP